MVERIVYALDLVVDGRFRGRQKVLASKRLSVRRRYLHQLVLYFWKRLKHDTCASFAVCCFSGRLRRSCLCCRCSNYYTGRDDLLTCWLSRMRSRSRNWSHQYRWSPLETSSTAIELLVDGHGGKRITGDEMSGGRYSWCDHWLHRLHLVSTFVSSIVRRFAWSFLTDSTEEKH